MLMFINNIKLKLLLCITHSVQKNTTLTIFNPLEH